VVVCIVWIVKNLVKITADEENPLDAFKNENSHFEFLNFILGLEPNPRSGEKTEN